MQTMERHSEGNEYSRAAAELVTYLATKLASGPNYGLTKLAKVFFQVDRRHYAEFGRTFSGLTFFKFKWGPFTKSFYTIIGNEPHLDFDEPSPELRVVTSRDADLRHLAHYLETIDLVIEEMKDKSGAQCSAESHIPGWELVEKDNHPIPEVTYVFGDHRHVPETVQAAAREVIDSWDAEV